MLICFADHSPPSQFGGTLPRRNDSSSGGGGCGGFDHNGYGLESDRRLGYGNNGPNTFGSCNNIIENIVPTVKPRVLSPCKISNGAMPGVKFQHQQQNQQNQTQQQNHFQQLPTARHYSMAPKAPSKDMDDLIHLPGPLTEDAVMRTLQARFAEGKHFVSTRMLFCKVALLFGFLICLNWLFNDCVIRGNYWDTPNE